ncbi:Golgin subfamily A member 1 [Holothuria leucospilota]|uniref:Golgin subfamily A member 1 n=1 Tax=Holothuria leucospilota TaxID=206669 RepID=A0A9Q1C3L7_HOLLE|nr:Golgin subfamily A member 1 [Holothuria leucospilota]
MFAKLKKKIAEEEGVDEGELKNKVTPGGAQRKSSRDYSRRPGETSPASLSPWGSTSSLASNTSATPTSTKKELLDGARKDASGSNKDEQIKRLEEKLDEYSVLLKEAVKSKEKMEATLLSHEEATNKKIQEMNEQYQLRRSKMAEKLANAVKKKEDELASKIEEIEKENASLQEQLQRLELTQFKKEEEQEDFQGFQVQELAKVKHMLLNSQETLQKCKADLEQSKEQLDEKSQLIEKQKKEIHSLKEEKAEILERRDQLQKSKDAVQETLSRMEKEVSLLEERCQDLTKEKQERETQLFNSEKKFATTQEELDALKFSEQSSKSQVKKQLEEKDRTIAHLQDKVSVIEQRLKDNSLSEDDQVTAIKAERDLLEKKLEETRKQLSDLKISSSEQISGLEKQISHLNAKITEDQEDTAEARRDLEVLTERYQKEMEKMEARIKELEEEEEANLQKIKKQAADLVLQKSASETEMMSVQRNFEQSKKVVMEQKQQLQEKVAGLEAKIIQLETARDFDKSASEHKIGRLQSANEEYLEKEIEHEKQVTQLEEEKERLQKQCQQVEKEKLDAQKQLEESKANVDNLQKKLADAESLSQKTLEEKRKLEENLVEQENLQKSQSQGYTTMVSKLTDKQIEIDDLKIKHASELAEIQRALSEKDGALGVLRENITQRETLCKQYEEQIKQLEQRLDAKHSELESHQVGSEEIGQKNQKLEDKVKELEEQLAERNKTIKMQQQRLSDLKKTLQRELKVQATVAGNDSSDEISKGNENHEKYEPTPGPKETPSAVQSVRSVPMNSYSNSPMDYREINFQYLRHVVFKFMSGTDVECMHLLKAVSVVLEFTQQEQKIIRETLEWKNSWFGQRPRVKNFNVKFPSGNSHIR